ncbi:MAG: META domain-containing protein [Thermoleophilia bacterium]|nr:META domain-containing protein [Thermoleophilia bacterium]
MRPAAPALALIGCWAVAGCAGDGDARAPSGTDLSGRTFVSTEDWSGSGSSFSTPVTVTFEAGGGLTWKADCNTAGADVEVTADRLLVGQIAATEIGCPGRPAKQDRDLGAFFASDPTWGLDGDRLTLSGGGVEAVLQATSGE